MPPTRVLAELSTPRALPPPPPAETPDEADAFDDGLRDRMLHGPFVAQDFQDDPHDQWLTTKLLVQIGCPAVPAMLLEMALEYRVDTLRLAGDEDLVAGLRAIASYAKGTAPALQVDSRGMTALEFFNKIITLKIFGERLAGFLLSEMAHRARTDAETLDTERTRVHTKLLKRIDGALVAAGLPTDAGAPA